MNSNTPLDETKKEEKSSLEEENPEVKNNEDKT